jgi:hypothetical protein
MCILEHFPGGFGINPERQILQKSRLTSLPKNFLKNLRCQVMIHDFWNLFRVSFDRFSGRIPIGISPIPIGYGKKSLGRNKGEATKNVLAQESTIFTIKKTVTIIVNNCTIIVKMVDSCASIFFVASPLVRKDINSKI